jgi:hypothetical protein
MEVGVVVLMTVRDALVLEVVKVRDDRIYP